MERLYARPIQVAEGVFQIRTVVARVTVVLGKDSVLVIDAGVRGSSRLVAAGLESLGVGLGDVELIALTHIHPDHAGGIADLAKASGATAEKILATYAI